MIEQKLFLWIHALTGASQILDFFGIFFAEYLGYFLILASILLIWSLNGWQKRMHYFSFLAVALILSRGIFTELIRFFYYRPRPFLVFNFAPLIAEAEKTAFPSGHAAFYFALALTVFLINRKWGWYFIAAASLMGLSRVFIGVHWPLDIIGGALVAGISVYIADLLFKPLRNF